jgi:hypothetical protein
MGTMRIKAFNAWSGILTAGLLMVGSLSLTSCSSTKETTLTNEHGIVEWVLAVLNESSSSGQTKAGNPQTIDSPYGKAVQFDGKGDALFLNADPLLNLHQFTIEVIMRPDPNGPAEQRFLQMGEVNGERVMMETRLTPDDQWYLDAYVRSGDSSRTLIDKTMLHPTSTWHHVAFIVDNGRMDTYVDGKHELEGKVPFSPFTKGKTSIGVRMNRVYWYKGAIYKIKVTPKSLNPYEFIKP